MNIDDVGYGAGVSILILLIGKIFDFLNEKKIMQVKDKNNKVIDQWKENLQ